MRHFPETLRLVKKLTDEAVSENYSATKDVSRVAHFDNTAHRRANEHDPLLYIETLAEHTWCQKLSLTISGRVLNSSGASFLQKLRGMYGST